MHTTPLLTSAHEKHLDAALSKALVAPPLPTHFRSQLMAQVHAQDLRDLHAQRKTLEDEHRLALSALNEGHLHLQRDTLALVVAVAFSAGACANLLLPWLTTTTGISAAVSVPLIAVAIGLGTSFQVWWERLGPSR